MSWNLVLQLDTAQARSCEQFAIPGLRRPSRILIICDLGLEPTALHAFKELRAALAVKAASSQKCAGPVHPHCRTEGERACVHALIPIVVNALGDSIGRTIEGGERAASPVVLVPFIRDGGPVDEAIVGEADGASVEDDEESGSFRELIDVGLIAREDEGGFDPFSDADPVSAFVGALSSESAPAVVGLGSNPRFWGPTLERPSNIPGARLLRRPDITPFGYDEQYRSVLSAVFIRDDGLLAAEDEYRRDVIRARVQARFIAGILEELTG